MHLKGANRFNTFVMAERELFNLTMLLLPLQCLLCTVPATSCMLMASRSTTWGSTESGEQL
jgi:hypothetical protein